MRLDKEGQVSEDESRRSANEEPEDESRRSANEEPKDDVEGHRRTVLANDEPKAEGEESDEVEAHMRRTAAPKKV